MNKKLLASAGAVVALGLSAGGAFTASNTIAAGVDQTAGFGTVNVTGATVNSLDYTYSTDGTTFTKATIVFDGDVSADVVKVGFGTGATLPCDTGIVDNTTTPTKTTVNCTLTQSVATAASSFNISVTDSTANFA